jgi:hypothetical protein
MGLFFRSKMICQIPYGKDLGFVALKLIRKISSNIKQKANHIIRDLIPV